ncbi:MAG: hypothetical protein J6M18_06435 [Actinomycetaceae bacterium]|nr:hypothetical protein [Actinomycetaceae bacterium]
MDNIGGRDYLQLLAYMLRFQVDKAYYIYPEVHNEAIDILCLNGVYKKKTMCACVQTYLLKYGLRIPQNAYTYSDFVSQMNNNEEMLIAEMKQSNL